MFGISLFDSLSAIGFVLGTFPVTDSSGIYDSYGTETTCNFEGMLSQVVAGVKAFRPILNSFPTSNCIRMDVSGRSNVYVLQRGPFDIFFVGYQI